MHRSDVGLFFKPSIDCIVKAVLDQQKTAHKPIFVSVLPFPVYLRPSGHQQRCVKHVVLVGGFAASDYMFKEVETALSPAKLNIVRPENHVCVSRLYMGCTYIHGLIN